MTDARPKYCRNRLRDELKAYPRSGCSVCVNVGLRGCPYEKVVPNSGRTSPTWLNFYLLGNTSSHFTRETADATALEVRDNPRIACIEVSAAIGEGLA